MRAGREAGGRAGVWIDRKRGWGGKASLVRVAGRKREKCVQSVSTGARAVGAGRASKLFPSPNLSSSLYRRMTNSSSDLSRCACGDEARNGKEIGARSLEESCIAMSRARLGARL